MATADRTVMVKAGEAGTSQSQRRAESFAIVVLFAIALALRSPTFGFAHINPDESHFALLGREILHGNWPFTTIFDHKPAGLYLHFAAALALFGDSPAAGRLLGWLAIAASAVLIRHIAIARLHVPRGWALGLAICFLIATTGDPAVHSEHLVNLYVLISAALLLREGRAWSLVSGVAAGVALNVNYIAVFPLSGMMAGYLLGLFAVRNTDRNVGLEKIALWLSGAALATVAMLAPITLWSDLGGYFDAQFAFLGGYGDQVDAAHLALRLAAGLAPFLPLLATVLVLAYFAWERAAKMAEQPGAIAISLLGGAALGAIVGASASGYVFFHYFLLLIPPLWLLAAALSAGGQDSRHRAIIAAVVVGTALTVAVRGLPVNLLGTKNLLLETLGRGDRRDSSQRIADAARGHVRAGDYVYTACSPHTVYQLLKARPATRYAFDSHHLDPRFAKALGIDIAGEIRSIFAKRPAVVVLGDYGNCWRVADSSWKLVRQALVDHGYQPFGRVVTYTLYRPVAEPAQIKP